MDTYTNLITAGQLQQGIGSVIAVDCRFDLGDPDAGRRQYLQAHVPGAVHAHLDQELSGPVGPSSGRHPLPEPDELARRLGSWGIDEHSQVVVYDDHGGAYAARLWWMLRWLGHERVAVLDGGFAAWRRVGAAIETGLPLVTPRQFTASPRRDMYLDTAQVLQLLAQGKLTLIDVRDAIRFSGEQEPLDSVAGHIPGAINIPYSRNLGDDGCFRSPEELRQLYLSQVPDPRAACGMCGSGVTACHSLLAMDVAGLPGSRLYAGSWSEWIRDPARPVASKQ
jgi:thiosulfate/3-mercaptopyruvate sulfurtransferase